MTLTMILETRLAYWDQSSNLPCKSTDWFMTDLVLVTVLLRL